MNQHVSHPTKSDVRRYIAQRVVDHRPPSTREEIRRQLGWNLIGKSARK
jgi:hypothetical protein